MIWFARASYSHPQQQSVTRQAYYPNATGNTLPANQVWDYVMSTGGAVTVSARLQSTNQTISRTFTVLGTNPTPGEILAELGGQWFWPNILIAELGPTATWRQFDAGHPVLGPPNGWGALQVEMPPGASSGTDQLAKMFNWKSNVAAAKQLTASNSIVSQNQFWDDYILWIQHAFINPPGKSSPEPYAESAPPRPDECLFASPWEVSPWSGTNSKSYIDAMTIKLYNGADRPYLRWNVDSRGPGWAVAPTQLKFPNDPRITCLRYVRRGCTLDFSNLPVVNNGCDAYHYQWVSSPRP